MLNKKGLGFKPYYNWNTFNTDYSVQLGRAAVGVLNLIITGIPSIPFDNLGQAVNIFCFKPYYNWNTFNTINGYDVDFICPGFKPYYNWNTFNTRRNLK